MKCYKIICHNNILWVFHRNGISNHLNSQSTICTDGIHYEGDIYTLISNAFCGSVIEPKTLRLLTAIHSLMHMSHYTAIVS